MGFRVRRAEGLDKQAAEDRFAAWGLHPRSWETTPGDRFEWHDHPDHKVLFCLRGDITFHGRDVPDIELQPGDRMDIEARTEHSATIGPEGVACIEAFAPGPPEKTG
jgi:quercetin dioxygenase-like cupin family protein